MRQPTSEEWAQINALFDSLADLPEAQWDGSLERAKVDAYVRQSVHSMLQASRAVGLLDLIDAPKATDSQPYSSLAEGTRVGAFRIVRLIARGGMGEVYLAERAEGFEQWVALKLLRPEAADRMASFDAERRLLAQLEHPGIARLIDGGIAPDGRPYMALEYVEGQPITAWCEAQCTDLDRRLAMMGEICEAVGYAHAHLVVHRDIKPGNIMVDGDGRVRLLDFGIAKVLGDGAEQMTLTQAMLTPDYAAPEQFTRAPVTVAADIYALGGVLYELLAGRGAWQREGAAPSQIARMIFDEPEAPSRAAARNAARPVEARAITGDLDAITLKAMRHDPAARYASAAELAADIRRHREFEPVEARQGALGYQLRRFVRRHKAATLSAGVALFALLVGSGGIAWQAHRAAAERDIAQAEARRAEAVNQAVVLMFRNAQEFGQGESESAKDLLNASAERLLASFGEHSPDTAPVVLAMSDLYLELGDLNGALSLLRNALDRKIGADDPVVTARMQKNLASAEGMTGKFDDATALLDASDKVWNSDPLRFRKDRLEAVSARAQILRLQGRGEEALKLLQASLHDAELEYAGDPRTLLIRYNNLAVHQLEANQLDQAAPILKRADALVKRGHLENTPMAITLLTLKGGLAIRQGQDEAALTSYQRAAALRRKLYGPSAALASDLMQVGMVQMKFGQYEQAIGALGEGEKMAEQYIGAANPVTAMAAFGLAAAYAQTGNARRARAALARSEPALKAIGSENAVYGNFLLARSQVASVEGDYAAAARDLDAVDALAERLGGAGATLKPGVDSMRTALKAKLKGRG